MKKITACFLAALLLLTSLSDQPWTHQVAAADGGSSWEAEDGQILFGELVLDEEASGSQAVRLGAQRPSSGTNPGIYWYIEAKEACTTTLTLEYSTGQGTVAYFYCNNVPLGSGSPEPLPVTADQERTTKTYDIALNAGVNELVLLCFSDIVVIDRLTLETEGAALIKGSPQIVDEAGDITHYYAKDAKVHMGQIAPNNDSVSKSCVIYMKDHNGSVHFDQVYSKTGGYYQLILFCGANAGSHVTISVNGQEQTVPVNLPLGWGAFTDGTNRTHSVVNANLKPGNNQVVVSCVDQDVCVDTLQAARLDPYARYEAEEAAFDSPVWKVADASVSGTGFVAGINSVDSEVRFRVNVAEDGAYALCARYFASQDMNSAEVGQPAFRIYTEEGYYGELRLNCDGTRWQIAEGGVSLKAGEQELILKGGNGDGYLDYIGIGGKTGPYQAPVDVRKGLDLEAEEGMILFGKLGEEGSQVTLGEDTPAGRNSGIIWNAAVGKDQRASVCVVYSAVQDTVMNFMVETEGQIHETRRITLLAGQGREYLDLTLKEGSNKIYLLHTSGGPAVLDRISIHGEELSEEKGTPESAPNESLQYNACDARIHMGNILGAGDSLSRSCVSELVHPGGNGYVEFDQIQVEQEGEYQLILFCAGEEGNQVTFSVNGQEYTVPILQAMGKSSFASPDGARSHGVVKCRLKAGRNQVRVYGAEDAEVAFDALWCPKEPENGGNSGENPGPGEPGQEEVQTPEDYQKGTCLEAEDGQIIFGRLQDREGASGGMAVTLGEDIPEGKSSGIFWNVRSEAEEQVLVTIEYSAAEDTQVLLFNNDRLMGTIGLLAGENKKSVPVGLTSGENKIAMLHISGKPVTVDRILLYTWKVSLAVEEPLRTENGDCIYFTRNGRIHMGNIAAAEDSVSGTSVSELLHEGGNGYVEFPNIWSETGGSCQLILFCTGEEGDFVSIQVNGQDYRVPILLPLGIGRFSGQDGTRSHAVVQCSLKPGQNQVRISGVENRDIRLDALCVNEHVEQGISTPEDYKKGTSLEAERGQIIFGKLTDDPAASGGRKVILGSDVPADRSSGIFWSVRSEVEEQVIVTVEYSCRSNAQLLIFNNDQLQENVEVLPSENRKSFLISLTKGENRLALLHTSGDSIAIDRILLHCWKVAAVTEEPIRTETEDVIYFTRNGRIHMGNLTPAENSVSGTCVSELLHKSGNGYVEFDQIYSETGGYYQFIVFCAGEEEDEISLSVNGQEYLVPILLAKGKQVFADEKDRRSHGVLTVQLNPGNNQVVLKGAKGADLQFDALMTTFLSDNVRYEAEEGQVINGVIKGKGCEYDYGSYSGTGFVGNLDVESSEVQFQVEVEEEGEYEIGICYSTGITDVNERPTFRVYTQSGYYDEVILPNVTGWGNFSRDTIATTKVSLKVGENTVIVRKGRSSAELDYIELGARTGGYRQPMEEPDNSGIRYRFEDGFLRLKLEAEQRGINILPILIGVLLLAAVALILILTLIWRKKKGGANER